MSARDSHELTEDKSLLPFTCLSSSQSTVSHTFMPDYNTCYSAFHLWYLAWCWMSDNIMLSKHVSKSVCLIRFPGLAPLFEYLADFGAGSLLHTDGANGRCAWNKNIHSHKLCCGFYKNTTWPCRVNEDKSLLSYKNPMGQADHPMWAIEQRSFTFSFFHLLLGESKPCGGSMHPSLSSLKLSP